MSPCSSSINASSCRTAASTSWFFFMMRSSFVRIDSATPVARASWSASFARTILHRAEVDDYRIASNARVELIRRRLKTSQPFVLMVSGPMADAFERTGEDELAERIDAEVVAVGGELAGASLATVRAARRAAKRGERDRAKELAQKVIRAWSLADDAIPAVEEMRKLLATLR